MFAEIHFEMLIFLKVHNQMLNNRKKNKWSEELIYYLCVSLQYYGLVDINKKL
jgi:hypothetical protein